MSGENAQRAAPPESLSYELHACRKGEETWAVIARFFRDEDARAALWAIVFTNQYAGVKVRREGAEAILAEWPEALRKLR